ncbi:MAG: hypothetical protein AUG74_20060 [Bacteroidetes bacterium 13_1_20CM_4_60_6]|nr:MAG: hypothetical protein AUG74_20060 [Bacteroidetes bacterium 13_1_20CM_4_60_6]
MAGYTQTRYLISRLTFGGDPILVIYGTFVRAERQCKPISSRGFVTEVLRGAAYRILDRAYPSMNTFRRLTA